MATEQEKAAVRRWFVEGTNPAIFDEVLAADVVMSMKGMEQPLKGVEAVKQLGMTMGTAFPDLFLTVDQMTDQGDTITVHWTGQGTHTGELRLPTGVAVPPTGKAGHLYGHGHRAGLWREDRRRPQWLRR